MSNCECDSYVNCKYFGINFSTITPDELSDYYLHANHVIRRSNRYNYQFCKFPVPTPWDVDKLEKMLRDNHYGDMGIIKLLRFGWPIEADHVAQMSSMPPNQKGARENPGNLVKYVEEELAAKSVIGPFKNNPFWQTSSYIPN